jgi:glycosyltransferase involved in cell wall biosynthesis
MKIIYYTRGLPRSTHWVYMEHTAEALRRTGNDVITCYPIGSERGSGVGATSATSGLALRTAAIRQRLPRIAWNLGQLLANRMSYRPLLHACRENEPDLIHESYLPFGTSGIRVARKEGIPLLLGVHEFAYHILSLISHPLKGYALRLDRDVTLASDGVMCISHVLRDQIVGWGYPEDRILVLHNAVEPGVYLLSEDQRLQARRELNAESATVIGYLQAWNALERFDETCRMLLGTMDRVLSEEPSAVFLLVGGGLLFEQLRRRLTDDPVRRRAVRLTGQVPHADVPRYLAAMDIAMCPEHSSFTSPMKLFEYMAAELPVVAPRQPNVEEILESGTTAILFPPGDAAELASKIVDLIRSPDLARRLGREARRAVIERHTWEAYGRALSDFAERIRSMPRRGHP